MVISLVVAAAENNAIGYKNELLWRLPNDMKFFKNTTWGMPVIMGRKTFESLDSKPLAGRFNIVISRHQLPVEQTDHLMLTNSLDGAIKLAKDTDCKEAYIIGGGQIYAESLPMADKVFLTRVHATLNGDTFFPVLPPEDWALASNLDFPADDKHAYAYSFQVWERK